MKKKLISIVTILCLVFPCLFSVACKNKEPQKESQAYTYSVCLKNAKGKVNANSLQSEYDYKKDENIAFVEDGEDYKISVTRTAPLSGELKVDLLESVDYSSVNLKINGVKETGFKINSGDIDNASEMVNLIDRYFVYFYEKMKSDTELVVDFSGCEKAKVTLDVSNLRNNDIKYRVISEEFLTLTEAMALETEFVKFNSDKIQVDYGTILAFDSNEQLYFKAQNDNALSKLKYSTYGSRYFVAENRVQYFEVKESGVCETYVAANDIEANGTLRLMFSTGILVASSYENMQSGNYISLESNLETYAGEEIALLISNVSKAFIELDDGAAYNYYLLNSIDEKMDNSNLLQENIVEGTTQTYLDLTGLIEDDASAKYLARKPKDDGGFYCVYFEENIDDAQIENADYVLVGASNISSDSEISSSIAFGFKKDADVNVKLSATSIEKTTNFEVENTKATITSTLVGVDSTSVEKDPVQSPMVTIDCCTGSYQESEDFLVYKLSVTYTKSNFVVAEMSVSLNDLNLYDDEEVYYTTNIRDDQSWTKLDESDTLTISHETGRTIYYFIKSTRDDAEIEIKNSSGKVISVTGGVADCFNRVLNKTVAVLGTEINLSRIKYLEIEPGIYSSSSVLSLVRAGDKTYHKILTNASAQSKNVMISINGYESETAFVSANDMQDLKIKTTQAGEQVLHYFVTGDYNYYVELTNQAGEVVSETEVIYVNDSALTMNNKLVYSLSLKSGVYAPDEEFNLEIKQVGYKITKRLDVKTDGSGYEIVDAYVYNEFDQAKQMELYLDDSVDEIFEGMTYYIRGQKNSSYMIVDSDGELVASLRSVTEIKDCVYKITFKFIGSNAFVASTEFALVQIQTNES